MVGFKHVYRAKQPQKTHCKFDLVLEGPNNYTSRLHGEECNPEKVVGGIAAGDYDGDGWVDVFFTVYYGSSLLYRNNGKLTRILFSRCSR